MSTPLNTMDLKEICIPYQSEVENLEKYFYDHLVSDVPFVKGVADYVIQNGGKRLRPLLTILSSKLAGYQGDAALAIGAAIEFMHTASLLHDDVLDNAELRRGRVSTNKKWGNHVSVLVGDFFYCRAMDILVSHGDLKILRAVTDAITITTEGEIFEITKSNDLEMTQDDYLQIIIGKTAALMGASCQAGGILGQVSDEFEHALQQFGLNLGIAFQLMDDVLDYVSNEKDFGKTSGTDLREGKITLPLLLTLQRCQPHEMNTIKNVLIADHMNDKSFQDVLQIIHHYDSVQDTMKLASSYAQKAKEFLIPFRTSLGKETLTSIADYVLTRNQ